MTPLFYTRSRRRQLLFINSDAIKFPFPRTQIEHKEVFKNEVANLTRSSKHNYTSSLNPGSKSFRKYVKSLRKCKSGIPDLYLSDSCYRSDSEKANVLNSFFSTCFNLNVCPLSESNFEDFNLLQDCDGNKPV